MFTLHILMLNTPRDRYYYTQPRPSGVNFLEKNWEDTNVPSLCIC